MIEVVQHPAFESWLADLRDDRARKRIAARIAIVQGGSLGDVRLVGEGVSEMRIDYGPGYRLYFVRRGSALIILLCGGDKSRQDRDIRRAKDIAAELKEQSWRLS